MQIIYIIKYIDTTYTSEDKCLELFEPCVDEVIFYVLKVLFYVRIRQWETHEGKKTQGFP